MSLLNDAGGAAYHWRAFRYSNPYWEELRQDIRNWLTDWPSDHGDIILVGPSGGYTLPKEWLAQFSNCIAIEPDPLARSIFELRFRKPHWVKASVLEVDSLASIFAQYPKASILFCNVLGQVPVLLRKQFARDEKLLINWKASIREALSGRRFASYHDIYSSQRRFSYTGRISNSEGSKKTDWANLIWPTGTEVIDHQMLDFFGDLQDKKYFKWTLTPKKFHLIEAVKIG